MSAKVASIFGLEEAKFFESFQADLDASARVEGLLPRPQLSGSNKSKLQLFYINKRPVAPPLALKSAIAAAFKASGIAKVVYILNVWLSPQRVDLNLTSDKRKVMLQDEARLADRLFVRAM